MSRGPIQTNAGGTNNTVELSETTVRNKKEIVSNIRDIDVSQGQGDLKIIPRVTGKLFVNEY